MPLEPLEHSVLGSLGNQRDVSSSDGDLRVDSMSACSPRVVSDDRGVEVAPLDGRPEASQTPPEAGDAIVVGVVGSAAPWFMIGWAHEVEVEFMIDTGCQVTILATTIFERMCTVDQLDLRIGQLWAGRPIDTTITSTETDPGGGWMFDDFGDAATGQ